MAIQDVVTSPNAEMTGGSGFSWFAPITALSNETIDSLRIKIGSVGIGNIRMAIYTSAGTLLTQTAQTAIGGLTNQVITIPLLSSVQVVTGASYWIGWSWNDASHPSIAYLSGSSGGKQVNVNFYSGGFAASVNIAGGIGSVLSALGMSSPAPIPVVCPTPTPCPTCPTCAAPIVCPPPTVCPVCAAPIPCPAPVVCPEPIVCPVCAEPLPCPAPTVCPVCAAPITEVELAPTPEDKLKPILIGIGIVALFAIPTVIYFATRRK